MSLIVQSKSMDSLTLSLVTAVFNRVSTLADAINSVHMQNCDNFEYIVIDGMSNDGTDLVVSQNLKSINFAIREPDNGIYDALNKGIKSAKGNVIGFLHADDFLARPDALDLVNSAFEQYDCDAVYGDLVYVDAENPNRIIRYWKSGDYDRRRFRTGWMPPHPTVYIKREIYEKYGRYRTDLGSAADYECMVRLMYKHQIKVNYIPEVLVKMRVGGESNASIKNRLNANRDDRQAWIENGLNPPWGLRFTKPLRKIPQYFLKPPKSQFETTP